MTMRVYLAGPEVFLPQPVPLYEAKKELCSRHGLEGVSPLDHLLDVSRLSPREAGCRISQANEDHMRSCDLTIANITPFRSPSADVGTAYEMGFMRALGRPVLAYTNTIGTLAERTTQVLSGRVRKRDESSVEDVDGMLIEDFELTDNLMLDGSVVSSGHLVVRVSANPSSRFTDLRGFEKCVRMAAQLLDKSRPVAHSHGAAESALGMSALS